MKIACRISLFIVAAMATFTSCVNTSDFPSVATAQQFTSDTTAINNYLIAQSIPFYKSSTGVRFVIDTMGKGFPPRLDTEVKVIYTGKLLSTGATFDANTADGPLSTYILGWQVGLSMLPKGTKGHLYIPSALGYGTQAFAGIPANANLIFDIKLTDVVTTPDEITQLSNDGSTIDTYLANHSISATTDTSGVRYVINTVGAGPSPTWFSRVTMTYSVNELTTGNSYFNGTAAPSPAFDSRVVNFIRGIQVGLQKLKTGGKITLYVPSGLAYGSLGSSNGTSTIPPNTNVIVVVQLTGLSNAN